MSPELPPGIARKMLHFLASLAVTDPAEFPAAQQAGKEFFAATEIDPDLFHVCCFAMVHTVGGSTRRTAWSWWAGGSLPRSTGPPVIAWCIRSGSARTVSPGEPLTDEWLTQLRGGGPS